MIDLQTDNCTKRLSLSVSLVVADTSMSLLSIPALVRKDSPVLYMPGYTTTFNVRDDFEVLGYVRQDAEGLFYDNDDGTTRTSSNAKGHIATVRAIMAMQQREREIASINRDSLPHQKKSSGTRTSVRDDASTVWNRRLDQKVSLKDIRAHVEIGLRRIVIGQTTNCTDCVK